MKTKIVIDESKIVGPRKPKGGGPHKDKRVKRKRTRKAANDKAIEDSG